MIDPLLWAPSRRYIVVNETDAVVIISQHFVMTEPIVVMRGHGRVAIAWDEPSMAAQEAKYVRPSRGQCLCACMCVCLRLAATHLGNVCSCVLLCPWHLCVLLQGERDVQ